MIQCSECDAGGATWRGSDSDRGSADLVAKDIECLSDALSCSVGRCTCAGTCGLRAGTSLLLFLFFFLVVFVAAEGGLRCRLSLRRLSLSIRGVILAIVVATEGEAGGSAGLMVHLDGGQSFTVSALFHLLSVRYGSLFEKFDF